MVSEVACHRLRAFGAFEGLVNLPFGSVEICEHRSDDRVFAWYVSGVQCASWFSTRPHVNGCGLLPTSQDTYVDRCSDFALGCAVRNPCRCGKRCWLVFFYKTSGQSEVYSLKKAVCARMGFVIVLDGTCRMRVAVLSLSTS